MCSHHCCKCIYGIVQTHDNTHTHVYRHELYQGYKGHREEPPESVSQGLEYATNVLQALNVRVLRIPGVEADDVIASLACRAAAQGLLVDIVSGDKVCVGVGMGGYEG